MQHSVLIADDHAIVRQATRSLLEEMSGMVIVGEVSDGLSAIAALKRYRPDLLVLDAGMPGARGIEVFAEARRWSPTTRVCLLTGFTSVGLLSDWLDAGVDGIVLKTSETEEIAQGFLTLLEGQSFVAGEVRAILERDNAARTLTMREREVLALIAAGLENRGIGERLSISPKTVEKHRGSLMAKLGVHSAAELIVRALREGLLDDVRQR